MRVIIIALALLAAVTISTLKAVADPTFRPTMVEAGVAPEGHVAFPIAFPKAPIVSVALSQARFVAATGCKPLALNVTGEGFDLKQTCYTVSRQTYRNPDITILWVATLTE